MGLRAPKSTEFLGISLAVSGVFVGVGFVLFGIQRHVAALAAAAPDPHTEPARQRALHVDPLVAHLPAAGATVCALLALLTYAIVERFGQGSAVFG